MIPQFPGYARLVLEGFGHKRDYGVLRTETDGGVAKQRPRYSKPIVTRSATLVIRSRADKLAFDAWHSNELNGGAGWFNWHDPLDRLDKRARFVKGELDWRAVTANMEVWTASCQLETIG